MPERTINPGQFGARGIRGSDAVARRLDDLAGGIATPVTVKRGLMARLNYLTRTPHARAAAKAAGLAVTDRTLNAWLKGKRRPNRASLEKIERAYLTVRRQNVAQHLLKRLNSGGGTRVEIHPLNQSQVARPHQRVVEYRQMNVRRWDSIVRAWAAGDEQGLDDAWTGDVLPDLGSQWGQYEMVTNVGFAA
ncbi:transcriptional regulator [Streptomyces sp. NBC_01465]|uniref:transcriptional regulator n=1 Tax=Streptomyces sp. NBC_01465 TaxID=2903878 RepID=UPI002E2EC0CC|nr:transcriptional regulator [Streptomyces sp. NBC_01465]